MINLYNNLMALVDDEETSFFCVDQEKDGALYRVFSYHIASYTEWLRPDAIECRGIMFEMIDENTPFRIASRPMQKFFNWGENPLTMNLDPEAIISIQEKADGSLISTFYTLNGVELKSKTSLQSDQAVDARRYLYKKENKVLLDALEHFETEGYTVNMEWCAPHNRIVLGYDKPILKILNIRNRETGEYFDINSLPETAYEALKPWLVDTIVYMKDMKGFIDDVRKQAGIEGFVCKTKDGVWFKIKTDWYVQLHSNKDSISNDKKLVLTVLDTSHDDLRAMFENDQVTLDRIDLFEKSVVDGVSTSIVKVAEAYRINRGKAKKDYALSGQTIFKNERHLFSVYMNAHMAGTSKITEQVFNVYKKYPELLIPKVK